MKNLKKSFAKSCLTIFGRIAPTTLSKVLFRISQHKKLNLKNPETFNEKLMWLKIYNYNHNKTAWQCADKYLVRKYAKKHGVPEDNLPKLLGVYQNVNEINFDKLPPKFALKCSHGCGFNIICQDKSKLDIQKTRKQLNKWLKTKFGYSSAETHYTHIKPVIMCEEFIDSQHDAWPYDYKLYCFNGEPKVVLVTSERETGHLKLNWYDLNWQELPYGHAKNRNQKTIAKPKHLATMIKIAKQVSKDFPFVRVDFYEYKNHAIMGEMTFTPAADVATYYNQKGQQELGNMLQLNIESLNKEHKS